MNSSTVAHRWANKDFGKYGTLTASNSCHSRGRNYFSYSTVFGQWVDLEKNVVLVYNGSTSPTSCKYKLHKSDFPKDVHVFPYDDGGYSYYHGCNLVSSYNFTDEDFKQQHRIKLLDYYVHEMYKRFENITTSKSKGAEYVYFDMWDYFVDLCSIYNDISVSKYLKTLKKVKCSKIALKPEKEYVKKYNAKIDKKKIMVKLLASGEGSVKYITDAMFGEGSYQKYMDYCERFRKADRNKQFVESLCHRLGIGSPYVSYRGYHNFMPHDMSASDIRKLTAKERNEIHFKALEYKERKEHYDERKQKYNKNRENAFKWVVGYECDKKKGWCGYEYDDTVTKCRNMFTGEEYDISGEYIYGFYWGNTSWSFNYDDFRKSEDKEQWMREFYAKVKEVQDTRAAIAFLKKYGILKKKLHTYDHDIYLGVTQTGERVATEEDKRVVNEFIRRQDAYFEEQERIKRARELQRLREEEERRREEEYQRQVKQEQIDECLGRGVEGCRDLWRKHLTTINNAERSMTLRDDDKFYFGGNVLLRFNFDKTVVETSKGIRIPIAVCKKFYPIFKGWHENPKTFKRMEIDTKGSGRYIISEYKKDILTAGCHDIAWTEMERMWNEIEKLNGAAV